MKKTLALFLAVVLSVTSVVCVFAAQTAEAEPLTVTFTGTNVAVANESINYYPGEPDAVRTLQTSALNLRNAFILVCNSDGTIVRIAECLQSESEKPQATHSVEVPAGGFAIAFHTGPNGDKNPELKAYYEDLKALGDVFYNDVRDVTTDWQIVVNDDASGATLYRGPAPVEDEPASEYTDVVSLLPTDVSKVSQVPSDVFSKADVSIENGKLTLTRAQEDKREYPSVEITEAAGKVINLAEMPYLHLDFTVPAAGEGVNGWIYYQAGDTQGQAQLSAIAGNGNSDLGTTTDAYFDFSKYIGNTGSITITKLTLSIYGTPGASVTWNALAFAKKNADEPAVQPSITWKPVQGDIELHGNNNKIENLINGDEQLDAKAWEGNLEFVGFKNVETKNVIFEIDIDLGEIKPIGSVYLDFFRYDASHIYMPDSVEIEVSTDGKSYYNIVGDTPVPIREAEDATVTKITTEYASEGPDPSTPNKFSNRASVNTRYIRVTISTDKQYTFLTEIGVTDGDAYFTPISPDDVFKYNTENETASYGIAVFDKAGTYELSSDKDPNSFKGSQITVIAWDEAANAYKIRFNETNAWDGHAVSHATPSVTLAEGELMLVITTSGSYVETEMTENDAYCSQVKWIMRGAEVGDYIVLDKDAKTFKLVKPEPVVVYNILGDLKEADTDDYTITFNKDSSVTVKLKREATQVTPIVIADTFGAKVDLSHAGVYYVGDYTSTYANPEFLLYYGRPSSDGAMWSTNGELVSTGKKGEWFNWDAGEYVSRKGYSLEGGNEIKRLEFYSGNAGDTYTFRTLAFVDTLNMMTVGTPLVTRDEVVTVDGSLDDYGYKFADWVTENYLQSEGAASVTPKDLAGKFALRTDNEKVYFAIQIDNTIAPNILKAYADKIAELGGLHANGSQTDSYSGTNADKTLYNYQTGATSFRLWLRTNNEKRYLVDVQYLGEELGWVATRAVFLADSTNTWTDLKVGEKYGNVAVKYDYATRTLTAEIALDKATWGIEDKVGAYVSFNENYDGKSQYLHITNKITADAKGGDGNLLLTNGYLTRGYADTDTVPYVWFGEEAKLNGFNASDYYADYTAVVDAIATASTKNKADYTADSWKALQDKINAVVYNKLIADQAAVDTMAQEITAAIDALVANPLADADYTEVNVLLDVYEKLVPHKDDYTTESWTALETAVNAVVEGKKVDEQETVDGWADAILTAIAGLTKVTPAVGEADYTAVDVLLTVKESLNKDDYTAESWKALEDAVAAVVEGKTADQQAEVNAMAEAIAEAIANLEKKAPSTDTPTKPGDDNPGDTPTKPDDDNPGDTPTKPDDSKPSSDPSNSSDSSSPQTGDSGIVIFAVLAVLALAGAIVAVRVRR